MFRVGVEQSSRRILRGCALTPNPLSHEGRGGFVWMYGCVRGTYDSARVGYSPCTPTLNIYQNGVSRAIAAKLRHQRTTKAQLCAFVVRLVVGFIVNDKGLHLPFNLDAFTLHA